MLPKMLSSVGSDRAIYTYLMLSPTDLLKAERVIGLIKNWSSVLAKEVRQENLTRLEDLSEQPAHFGEVEIYTRCQALHSLHRKAVENGKKGG